MRDWENFKGFSEYKENTCFEHLQVDCFLREMCNRPKYVLWALRKNDAQLHMTLNTYAIISVMLVCRFVYAKTLLDFEGWLEKTRRETIVMDILHACKFIKKWLQHRCFPVNFVKLSRTTYANRWFFLTLWTPLM